jgi:hypothetical protein
MEAIPHTLATFPWLVCPFAPPLPVIINKKHSDNPINKTDSIACALIGTGYCLINNNKPRY